MGLNHISIPEMFDPEIESQGWVNLPGSNRIKRIPWDGSVITTWYYMDCRKWSKVNID